MNTSQTLIAELEDAIRGGSQGKRVDTLRRITDLFIEKAPRLTTTQTNVFDDVLSHLITRVEAARVAELSRRIAPVERAPVGLVRRLAWNDDIAVAEPVLSQSTALASSDLIKIANAKSQAHLLAISGRNQLHASVTEILLRRGDQRVTHRLADNPGARFSSAGFGTLVKRSEPDEQLAEKVGLRLDVPLHLFRQLLMQTTEAARSRLLARASPESRARIQHLLGSISEELGCQAAISMERDYTQAERKLLELHSKGELSEASLLEFVKSKKYTELTVGISLLCSAPVELIAELLQSEHAEAYLIPCKAAGLKWSTVLLILSSGSIGRTVASKNLESARADYYRLTRSSANRVLRFFQVRRSATVAGGAQVQSPQLAAVGEG